MTMIVYADFTSPASYLASRRVDALRAAGVTVEWRAVEVRPDLPVSGLREEADRARLGAELAAARNLLLPDETLPGQVPPLLAKTEAAVSAYAEAVGSGVAEEVRRLLFELYWVDGADIGNPNVLRTPLAGVFKRGRSGVDALDYAGMPVSVTRGPITTDGWRLVQAWQSGRRHLGADAVPVVLAEDGLTLHGEVAVRRLGKEMAYYGASADPELDDPRRYPEPRVHPGPTWSSWHGGRWLYHYRTPAA